MIHSKKESQQFKPVSVAVFFVNLNNRRKNIPLNVCTQSSPQSENSCFETCECVIQFKIEQIQASRLYRVMRNAHILLLQFSFVYVVFRRVCDIFTQNNNKNNNLLFYLASDTKNCCWEL